MERFFHKPLLTVLFLLAAGPMLLAIPRTATIQVNSAVTYQKITGFGGFVCSPQFGYNHMTTAEIQKIWGKGSDAGYNIMRLYLPIGESGWSQSLSTAKLAKSLGLKIFASPWSMPSEWKTNGRIEGIYNDTLSYLKEEYYDEYADYLNRYVTYLRSNGVELDAISIQNEPDMDAEYAGCIWTPAQMAKFIRENAGSIDCKVMAPESVGFTDNYVNALLDDTIAKNIDIYAGHQYGYLQNGLKKMQAKGKEIWMTEYLINWNSDENTTRNFDWIKDGFSFAKEVNRAMLANVNAWIHYAAKRYYGLIGDGTMGTTAGVITKRGYILAQYAKNTIGSTRVETVWKDEAGQLQGSSYLSASGDSVVIVVINPSADSYTLTLDLPFYTQWGKNTQTTGSQNMVSTVLSIPSETCRPKATIKAYSVNTFLFTKSGIRPVSQMQGKEVPLNPVESMTPTSTSFGTAYRLSGKSVTFDHSNSLFSANTTAAYGYLRLNDRYAKLVFHLDSIASKGTFTSANTTLYYVNAAGAVNSYNYGTIAFTPGSPSDWVLDISRSVLTDGCTGIIGLTNGNWNSVLTLWLGKVYLLLGSESSYTFTGVYTASDSELLNGLEDPDCVSLDFSGTKSVPMNLDWHNIAENPNLLVRIAPDSVSSGTNVVAGATCQNLILNADGGNFLAPAGFNATEAVCSLTLNGKRWMVLPFATVVPAGVRISTLRWTGEVMEGTVLAEGAPMAANTPFLAEGTGTFTFEGSGTVVTPRNFTINAVCGNYVSAQVPAGSYVLSASTDTVLTRVTAGLEPVVAPFSCYFQPATALSQTSIPIRSITVGLKPIRKETTREDGLYYDLSGRRVERPRSGFYLQKGHKIVVKP